MNLEPIKQLLYPYDASTTECDGMTRMVHTLLAREQIPHQVFVGSLYQLQQNKQIAPHFWVDLAGEFVGVRIDFRAQMWLGNNEGVPHGVFQPQYYSTVRYVGEPISFRLLSDVEFYVLTMPLPCFKIFVSECK